MKSVGLWQIQGESLRRVTPSAVDLEKSLEQWIESDPSMVQEGLSIVARQLTTVAGRLDLLAIDLHGRWTVIEIKRGSVGRETVAQALDYASAIAEMPADELRSVAEEYVHERGGSLDTLLRDRDASDAFDPAVRKVAMIIVGTGRAPGLERISSFLSTRHSVALSVVTFDVFELPDGSTVLAREGDAPAPIVDRTESGPSVTAQDVVDLASTFPTGKSFAEVRGRAVARGLYPRAWKTSIMYTAPQYRTQMLFTVWAKPVRGLLRIYVSHESFTDFYPVSVEQVARHLGQDGDLRLDGAGVTAFLTGLEALFAEIDAQTAAPDES